MQRSVFLFLIPLLLQSCISEKCAPDSNSLEEGGGLNFHLVDARTGQDLLAQLPGNGPRYSLDSVMVYNERGEPQFRGAVDFRGEIAFSTYGSTRELNTLPYHTALQRRFTLYLNRADQDTIDVAFSLRKNECGFSEFEKITIHYNTQFMYEGSGTRIPSRVFRKK
jgi:hypothetical protein